MVWCWWKQLAPWLSNKPDHASCSRWRIIRANQRWLRGPTSYCTRTPSIHVPHKWPSGPGGVNSQANCRRLPLVPLYQICSGPHPTPKRLSLNIWVTAQMLYLFYPSVLFNLVLLYLFRSYKLNNGCSVYGMRDQTRCNDR